MICGRIFLPTSVPANPIKRFNKFFNEHYRVDSCPGKSSLELANRLLEQLNGLLRYPSVSWHHEKTDSVIHPGCKFQSDNPCCQSTHRFLANRLFFQICSCLHK